MGGKARKGKKKRNSYHRKEMEGLRKLRKNHETRGRQKVTSKGGAFSGGAGRKDLSTTVSTSNKGRKSSVVGKEFDCRLPEGCTSVAEEKREASNRGGYDQGPGTGIEQRKGDGNKTKSQDSSKKRDKRFDLVFTRRRKEGRFFKMKGIYAFRNLQENKKNKEFCCFVLIKRWGEKMMLEWTEHPIGRVQGEKKKESAAGILSLILDALIQREGAVA